MNGVNANVDIENSSESDPKYDFKVIADDLESNPQETATINHPTPHAASMATPLATPLATLLASPSPIPVTASSSAVDNNVDDNSWISATEKQIKTNGGEDSDRVKGNNFGIYGIKDLEILEREKDYQEFFQHARDILPAERSQQWKSMVNHMAESFLYDQLKKKNIQEESISFINSLAEWPLLQENLFFVRSRLQLGVQYFKKCLMDAMDAIKINNCLNKMYTFWQNYPQDPEIGIELGKVVHDYDKTGSINHWMFFRPATNSENSEIFCKKIIVKQYLLKELYKESLKEENDNKLQRKISSILNEQCWQQIKSDVYALLFDQSVATTKQLFAYRLLSLFKEIDDKSSELFLIVYVLNGPLNDKTFNRAWNSISLLGKNYGKREKIIPIIKTMDPLPGKLFSIVNNKRKEVILEHLYANFPEYLDFYALTCVNYLNGKTIYKNGNPTPNCRDFFKSTVNKNWPNPMIKEQYERIIRL